ncbi:hypothetical protein HRbin36_02296 [bacterium HR36]|nr:hypothetical protein HRbin36_02296 [bacterium HR36]
MGVLWGTGRTLYWHTTWPLVPLVVMGIAECWNVMARPGKDEPIAEVARWGVYEAVLKARREFAEPVWDVRVEVIFVAPSGKKQIREAFWDGGGTWRVRFSPDEIGTWHWNTEAKPEDSGLHQLRGNFRVREYTGDNPLYRHGPLRVANNGTYLEHVDGRPFFWLADTAWNGVLKATLEDWERYLMVRHKQGFTAIQFVSTQWRGGDKSLQQHVFSRPGKLRVHPETLSKLDRKIARINEYHLVAVPVLLWALLPSDPGEALPEAEAQRLCEYLMARWGAYQVVWLLGGDGAYRDTERWKRLGRNLFVQRPRDRLVSLHPSGQNWVWDRFRDEPWVDFLGYQSGHGDNEAHLRWLVQGPPARSWKHQPPKPILNLEPHYETHPAYHSRKPFEAYHVRRAAYWSLLVTPPAGVTYGHNAIWPWLDRPGRAEGHEGLGEIPAWPAGLETEGISNLRLLRQFFSSGPWPKLRPAQELLLEQPSRNDATRFITLAATPERTWLVAYLPRGGTCRLRRDALPNPASMQWFDPRTGEKQVARPELNDQEARFSAPDDRDWVLDIRSE